MQIGHPLSGVKTRRQLKGITASRASQVIGVTANTYSKMERGEAIISLPRAKLLASILGCTMEQLGEEPSLDERIAALREEHDGSIAGHTTAPAPASDSSVVSAPPAHAPITEPDEELEAILARLRTAEENEQ
jgi:transcriptional regulator with XRE-family HTH domain